MKSISGWLLVYLVGSALMTLFYATGLAGRFFDYHAAAITGIFLILGTPLLLVVMKVPSAPIWNIASLWVGAGSISLVLLIAAFNVDAARLKEVGAMIVLIVIAATTWAAIWTAYFLRSGRVALVFSDITGKGS